MEATAQELTWARAIKAASAEILTEGSCQDFEYLQHGIIAKEKIHKALKRMKKLHHLKERYSINDNAVEGMDSIRAFLQQLPGCILAAGQIPSTGRYLLAFDYRDFDAAGTYKEEKDYAIMMKAYYYLMQASQPTVEAVREGIEVMILCHGFGWRSFSLELELRAAELYSDSYPVRIKSAALLDGPAIIRIMYNIVKVFLSRKVRGAVQFISQKSYLSDKKDVYPAALLHPVLGGECTEQALLDGIEEALRARYDVEETFAL